MDDRLIVALDVPNAADLLAAEDTRTLRHLMAIHGIPLRGRQILSYHDHNADRARPAILTAITGFDYLRKAAPYLKDDPQ